LGFSKLAKVMETKGVKILKNMKIDWIYVLSSNKTHYV
jgi:hypothetical protein